MAAGREIVLVTGAAGFIGRALCARLRDEGFRVRALVRAAGTRMPPELAGTLDSVIAARDLAGACPWPEVFRDVGSVVHLAGRSRVSGFPGSGRDLIFRDNLDGTRALARAAVRAGIKRFIFLSSVKVNGEGVMAAVHKRPYRATDPPRPRGAYAVSKWRAEQELREIFAGCDTELVIFRAPLVYGPGAGGNLAGLSRWLELGLPLPVPVPENRRSLLGLEKLVTLILGALSSAEPSESVLLPADDKSWSLEELARFLVPDRRLRLVRVPGPLLRFLLLKCLRRPEIYRKLYGSLLVES